MSIASVSEVDSLLSVLQEADKKEDREWMASLNSRKREELQFHDRWRDETVTRRDEADGHELLQANNKYYSTVALSRQYVQSWLATWARDGVFLDYACGNGAQAIQAAQAGASLAIGLDISRVSVENARRRAAQQGVTKNTFFVQGDCENTGLPSNSIDAVLCSGMLHHLDLSFAFPELRRILKPGGRCLALEALDYNPLIKLYRFMTPALRTEWEKHHILSHRDLRFASRFFEVKNVKYWHLTSILTTPLRNTRFFTPALKLANTLDSTALKIFPVSRMAWMFSFELCKRSD